VSNGNRRMCKQEYREGRQSQPCSPMHGTQRKEISTVRQSAFFGQTAPLSVSAPCARESDTHQLRRFRISCQRTTDNPSNKSQGRKLRVLQAGFAGMPSGTLCVVLSVEDKYVTMEGGKKAQFTSEGRWWEWVTDISNDTAKAGDSETKSTATFTAGQQLRILGVGYAGMASGTLCNVVSVNDKFVTFEGRKMEGVMEGMKKAPLGAEGKVWEWVQRPAKGITDVEEDRSDTEPREAQKAAAPAEAKAEAKAAVEAKAKASTEAKAAAAEVEAAAEAKAVEELKLNFKAAMGAKANRRG